MCSIYNCLDHMLGACTQRALAERVCAQLSVLPVCECSVPLRACVCVCGFVSSYQLGNLMDCAASLYGRLYVHKYVCHKNRAYKAVNTHTHTHIQLQWLSNCLQVNRKTCSYFHAKKATTTNA